MDLLKKIIDLSDVYDEPSAMAHGGRIGFYKAGQVKPQPQYALDQAREYYGREFKDLPSANKGLIKSGRIKELLDEGKTSKMQYAETAKYKDLIKEKVKASKKAGKPESYQSLYRFLKGKGYPITQEAIDAGYEKVNKPRALINKALGSPVPGKDNQFSGGLRNYLTKDKTVYAKHAKAAQKAVLKAIGKQPEILEFVLNNPDTDTPDIAKKFNLKKREVNDKLKKILTRVYLSKEPGASTWVQKYSKEQLSEVVRNIRGLPSFTDDFEKRMTSLIQEAYKDKPRNTYLKARKRYFDYSKAVRAISDKFGKVAEYNLDHIIPLDFLYKSKEGRDPMDLIRVRPTTRAVNTFKSRFDRAFIKLAKQLQEKPYSETLQGQRKAFNNLSKVLPKEFKLGEITPKGDFKSFKAKPLSGTQSYLQAVKDAPTEQNILIDYLKTNKDKPEFKNALKKVGMDPNQFIALAEKRKLPAKKIVNFLDKEISKGSMQLFSNPFFNPSLMGKVVGDLGKGVNVGLGPTGMIALTKYLEPEGGYDLSKTGDRLGFEAEAALAKPLVSGAVSVTDKIKNPMLRKIAERAALAGMSPAFAMRAARVGTPVGLASLAGEGLYSVAKHSKPNYYIDPKTQEPTFYKREKASDVFPTFLDIYDQAQKIAKEKGISYKEALQQIDPSRFYDLNKASGGRAGYMGGGITGIRKPHAIPPERQGLRSIMINGKKS